ncbi:MAG: nucleotide sugar dehydrogenase [Elusimicrobia bacterium]|nr:nucleotide sugar dehydrogenase [Elusimicrobiota bacterium]
MNDSRRPASQSELAETISVIGLGYVGLPLAAAFGRKRKVIGFDVSARRVAALKKGVDWTEETDAATLKAADIEFTTDPARLKKAFIHIIAVPTPVDEAKVPDLGPLLRASETVARILKKGDIVVYESTVYPGATEEDCAPVLEKFSGLKCGKEFTVAYSPERINPGDKEHAFTRIKKIVSGQDARTLEVVADLYGSVVEAGVHRAPSIRVAEAAKVIENTQRDINIALMNELSLIFNRMGIDTHEVLEAAGTKWNFLRFVPGLVGGHCIGVDPYYLTHKAAKLNYTPQVILAGRRINDEMGVHVAREVVRLLSHMNYPVKGGVVTVLGMTFKENVSDIRNSRVIDIVRELRSYGATVQVYDPVCDARDVLREYGVKILPLRKLRPANAVILAVAHKEFISSGWPFIVGRLKGSRGIVADLKAALTKAKTPSGVQLWRL